MSEQDSYQKLLEATRYRRGKIDACTMHTLALWVELGHDVNTLSVPMLAMITASGFEKVKEHATIYSRIDNIVALAATPAQLLELMNMPEIISLEASRPGESHHLRQTPLVVSRPITYIQID